MGIEMAIVSSCLRRGIRHLEQHGCALVHNALCPDTCQKLKDRGWAGLPVIEHSHYSGQLPVYR